MNPDDSQPADVVTSPIEKDLRDTLLYIATLVSTIFSILSPLSQSGKVIALSLIFWGFCYYLRSRQSKSTNKDREHTSQYVYPKRIRDVAHVGLISIPSLLIGAFGLSLVLIPKETAETTPVTDPLTIDTMDELPNWTPSFCDEACGGPDGPSTLFVSLVPGKTNNAVEVIYDLRKSGWVLITRKIDPNVDLEILSKTAGISFMYKSSGLPTTIELKLLLRYPGDTEDTVFGTSWKADTSDTWTRVEARYQKDFSCWWPADLCKKHGNFVELIALKRIDLAISNKLGDTAGLGKLTFDDLVGISP